MHDHGAVTLRCPRITPTAAKQGRSVLMSATKLKPLDRDVPAIRGTGRVSASIRFHPCGAGSIGTICFGLSLLFLIPLATMATISRIP